MVLLRICLSLAILAGIGVIVLSQVVLKPQIQGIIDTRDTNKKNWDKAETDKKKLNKDLAETKTELKSTKDELDTTKTQLTDANKSLQDETKRATDRAAMIEKLNKQVKTLDDDLAAWKATGFTVEQIMAMSKQLKDFKAANEAYIEENKLLAARVERLQRKIDELVGKNIDPEVPATVRGKVLVVDPKWDFIVLDVGAKQNLPTRGVLLISRNGALVAKVRVMNVQQDRAIANIMPGWKLKDVMEGDQVFPYAPTNL